MKGSIYARQQGCDGKNNKYKNTKSNPLIIIIFFDILFIELYSKISKINSAKKEDLTPVQANNNTKVNIYIMNIFFLYL